MTNDDELERVAKIMSERGLCSRREAERLIAAGEVRVDGDLVTEQGTRCRVDSVIEIGEAGGRWQAGKITVIVNKPPGIDGSAKPGRRSGPWQLLLREQLNGTCEPELLERILAKPWLLSPTGRLDAATSGLLILSNDGVLAKRLTGPQRPARTWQLIFDRRVEDPVIATLTERGLRVARDGATGLTMTVAGATHEGLRGLAAEIGIQPRVMRRIAVGSLKLGRLPEGAWRPLQAKELASLRG